MPSDETELDRLDMVHHVTLNILDGELYTAPLAGKPLHNVYVRCTFLKLMLLMLMGDTA